MAAINSILYVLFTSTLTSPPEYEVTTEVTGNDIDPRCPPNEVYSKCETECGDGNQLDMATVCPEVCIYECVCKPGFVRGRHGSCFKPQHYSTSIDEKELQQDIDPDVNGGCPDTYACVAHCGPKMGFCSINNICVCHNK